MPANLSRSPVRVHEELRPNAGGRWRSGNLLGEEVTEQESAPMPATVPGSCVCSLLWPWRQPYVCQGYSARPAHIRHLIHLNE